MTDFDSPAALLADLRRLATTGRHPGLHVRESAVGYFATRPGSPAGGASTELVRGAVMLAAHAVATRTAEDHRALLGTRSPSRELLEASVVYRFMPPAARESYDVTFFGNVALTAAKVCYDLARPDGPPPACIAEQLLVRGICRTAEEILGYAGLPPTLGAVAAALLPGVDADLLFATVPLVDVAAWFAPLNSSVVVHPLVEALAS